MTIIIVDKSYFNKIKKYNAPFFSTLVSDCFENNQIVKEINI